MAWVPGGPSGSGGWIWVGDGAPDSPFPGSITSDPTTTTSDTGKPVEHGRVLLAVGEGTFAGLVDGLKTVYLNDVPIQNPDGTFNFSDVSVAVCNGTLTQNPITGFEAAESEVGVGQKVLKSTPIVRSITDTNATHGRVKISVPSLQTIDTTTGKTSSAHLQYVLEVQPNGGSYQNVTLDDGGIIEKQFTSKYIKGYKFALPGSGPWNVRLTRLENDSSSQYLQNDLYFESIATIIDGKFTYPMTALLAVACNADQFNTIPKVTADWKARIISVPANYDPIARTYATTGTGTTAGTWDGTFKQAWSDNPAWVFYDMVTNNLFGCGLSSGAPDKWLLYAIAQYCDVMVSDGQGGTEPRFTCSVNIESRDEAITVLGYLASIFRGSAYWAGGAVVPIQDKDEAPSSQFTNSNVVDGKFTYTSSAKPARHTACIVKYNDPTNGYELTPLLVQDNVGVARYGYNPLEVVAYGCASRGQASRLGLMALTTELSQTEGVTFSTAMEGIPLRPGKIIKISDAFRFGKRFGGRVLGSTTTTVTLDAPVTLEAGKTYQLSCTLPSGAIEVKSVSTGAGTVSAITVSSAFSAAPQVEGQWILVANDFAPMLYRVLSIKEGQDGAYEVSALIHNPDKYAAVEAGLILDALPSISTPVLSPVTNLTLTESMAVQTDRLVSTLLASWTPCANITGYTAVASRDGGPWQPMTVAGSGATLVDCQPGTYRVRVVACYDTGNSVYVESAAYTTTGFATTTSPAQAAQNGVNAINSVDALTNADKIALMSAWKAELQTQSGLDATATSLGITTEKTAYDNAMTALSTGLIAAGAPSNWASIWPDGSTLAATGITTSLAGWWSTIAQKRATLQTKISQAQSANAQADAVELAATTAMQKADFLDANGKIQTVRIADASIPASKLASGLTPIEIVSALPTTGNFEGRVVVLSGDGKLYRYHGSAYTAAVPTSDLSGTITAAQIAANTITAAQIAAGAIATDELAANAVTAGKIAAATITGDRIAANTLTGNLIAAKTILAKNLTISNFDNLIPNPNSEALEPAGGWPAGAWETAALDTTSGQAYEGTGCRIVPGAAYNTYTPITPLIPCNSGEAFYLQAQGKVSAGSSGKCRLFIQWYNAAGENIATANTASNGTAAYALLSVTYTAPAGAVFLQVYLGTLALGAGNSAYFDAFYLRRMFDANLTVDGFLQAIFIKAAKAIQSLNYAAGAAGSAPVGFCLSATPFTTTFKDGTTDSGCLMELGGSANFGGYKVATINTQVMTAVNRIVNGSFWMSSSPWSAQPRFVYTITANPYQNIDYYGSTVTASQSLNGPGYTTGTIRLKFTPSATFVLNSGGAASPGPASISFRVTVYMKNHYTGTQTTLYQQSASAAVGSPWSPGQQSIDVTSLLSTIPAGYGVAAVIDNIYIYDYNGSGSATTTYTGTIDVTGFELIF